LITADPRAVPVQGYAGIVTRTVAFAIDLLALNAVLFGAGLVAGLVIEAFGDFSPDLDLGGVLLGGAVWSVASAVYFTAWWALTGQTPGMRALGIEVRTTSGDRVRPRRGLLRVVGMSIAAIPFFAGYFLILVSDRRQGLHDKLARTIVVHKQRDHPPARRRGQARLPDRPAA
jgi:uncharacterized RDD family membrane protein YckC